MNYTSIGLAALGGFVAYFATGGLIFVAAPWMKNEFLKYPSVYRSKDEMNSRMPIGMAAYLVAIVVLAVIYAMLYQGGPGYMEGARFGALIGLFVVCAFVLHNHLLLNIGGKLTFQQSVAYFLEWTVTGLVIGLIYRAPAMR
jgi:hypothetical protein